AAVSLGFFVGFASLAAFASRLRSTFLPRVGRSSVAAALRRLASRLRLARRSAFEEPFLAALLPLLALTCSRRARSCFIALETRALDGFAPGAAGGAGEAGSWARAIGMGSNHPVVSHVIVPTR